MNYWCRENINTKEFKTGLKEAEAFDLTMAKISLGIELNKGKKVRSKFEAVQKEIERRKKNRTKNRAKNRTDRKTTREDV